LLVAIYLVVRVILLLSAIIRVPKLLVKSARNIALQKQQYSGT